jgi:predicted Holliday junction resolvase-like endonuclease
MLNTLLILVILGLGYVIYNLLNKVEKYEERILSKTDDIQMLLLQFRNISDKMREIDNKKIFESDDEVGSTFEMLKNLIEANENLLDQYINEDDSSSDGR